MILPDVGGAGGQKTEVFAREVALDEGRRLQKITQPRLGLAGHSEDAQDDEPDERATGSMRRAIVVMAQRSPVKSVGFLLLRIIACAPACGADSLLGPAAAAVLGAGRRIRCRCDHLRAAFDTGRWGRGLASRSPVAQRIGRSRSVGARNGCAPP